MINVVRALEVQCCPNHVSHLPQSSEHHADIASDWGVREKHSVGAGHQPGDVQRWTVDFDYTVAVSEPPSVQYWVRTDLDGWHRKKTRPRFLPSPTSSCRWRSRSKSTCRISRRPTCSPPSAATRLPGSRAVVRARDIHTLQYSLVHRVRPSMVEIRLMS